MGDQAEVRIVGEDAWQELASGFLDHNYRQCRPYARAAARRVGASSQPVAIVAGAEVLGIADVRTRRLPVVPGGIAYINGGPLTRRGAADDLDRLGTCVSALRRHFVDGRGFVLRIVGCLGPASWIESARERFASASFLPTTVTPGYRTFLVDLKAPLAAIRTRLAQKWRNGLNQAERYGLTVRSGTDGSMFAQFRELFAEFLTKKGFLVEQDADFFGQVQAELGEGERLEVHLAEQDGRVVAGMVCSRLGDTCVYLLGASNDEAHKRKASYLLQWTTIASAHARGLAWYDLGGIDPVGNPGVFHFKAGLGGVDLQAPGPFQAVPGGLRGRIVLAAEQAWRRLRALRRRGR